MRYNEQLLASLALGLTLLFAIWSTSSTSLYAQQQLKQSNSAIVGVKITSPTKGQQVPIGSLTISGTSTDNANSDCTVYTDWNDLGPYQKVLANGPGGTNDYSKWSFTYTSAYHLITNGTNDLTAKMSCLSSSSASNITKWYSVNVTGIATTNQITKTVTTNPPTTIPRLPMTTAGASTNNNNNNNDDDDINQSHTQDQDQKELSISINVAKDHIVPGNKQTIAITISDAKSNDKVYGAIVQGAVYYLSDYEKTFSGITDKDGQINPYSWKINGNAKPGKYTVEVHASADGDRYKSVSKTSTFMVISASSSSSSNDNIIPFSISDEYTHKNKHNNDDDDDRHATDGDNHSSSSKSNDEDGSKTDDPFTLYNNGGSSYKFDGDDNKEIKDIIKQKKHELKGKMEYLNKKIKEEQEKILNDLEIS